MLDDRRLVPPCHCPAGLQRFHALCVSGSPIVPVDEDGGTDDDGDDGDVIGNLTAPPIVATDTVRGSKAATGSGGWRGCRFGRAESVMASGTRSHLLCHAAEGYYVPCALDRPLLDTEVSGGAGTATCRVLLTPTPSSLCWNWMPRISFQEAGSAPQQRY